MLWVFHLKAIKTDYSALTDYMQLVVSKAILRTSIGSAGNDPTHILNKRRRPEEKHPALSQLVKKTKAPAIEQNADCARSQIRFAPHLIHSEMSPRLDVFLPPRCVDLFIR